VKKLKRFLPLVILIVGMIIVFSTGLHEYLSFETLKNNRENLLNFLNENPILMAILYMGLYILMVSFSLPGAAITTIAGGFLFGQILGTFYVVFAATVGATILFLIAQTALGDSLRNKAGPWFKKMEKGFQENQFSYLMTLRLIPLFPFFVVNLVPAFLGMRLLPYMLATFIGIIPGTFVYISVGVGLGSIFDKGGTFSTQSILTPEIILALCGLALLSILPVLYKKFRKKR